MARLNGGSSSLRTRLFLLFLLSAPLVVADRTPAAELSPKRRAVLGLRILAYDRNVRGRSDGKQATVLVVYRQGNEASEAAQAGLSAALEELAGTLTVGGLPVRVRPLPYNPGDFEAKLAAAHPVAAYVCPGLTDATAAISAATRRHQVLSMTGADPQVRAGLAVGVVERDDKAGVLVNLPAARAEGADFDAALLRSAEVIR